ncbi:MAG: DUF488 family protein [Micrococcales bacterium]|nr:DUF488 family protein [Micrococcales bacterium]
MTVSIKRVYDAPEPGDGTRVLVDRLWPRGVSKKELESEHAEWLKDIAPSNELRAWFGHDASRFEEFERRYEAELAQPSAAAAYGRLCELRDQGDLTLLYAAKDEEHNNAEVLQRLLTDGWEPGGA